MRSFLLPKQVPPARKGACSCLLQTSHSVAYSNQAESSTTGTFQAVKGTFPAVKAESTDSSRRLPLPFKISRIRTLTDSSVPPLFVVSAKPGRSRFLVPSKVPALPNKVEAEGASTRNPANKAVITPIRNLSHNTRMSPIIQLNHVEAKLRQLLLDVAKYINPQKPIELRYTGGWVRDKLLGTQSHDIDVAINDMTGYQFALRMKEYLEIPKNAENYELYVPAESSTDGEPTSKDQMLGGLHKIEANPEKSKHLETVTTKLFGLDIDIVNLRKEVYDEISRNPQMEFGTPVEDAERRDATINALFYNLQTEEVEDFSGRGLHDLKNKLIMCPMEPLQTFKDDPLRVLRLIRFASRLGFTIDPVVESAMKDASVKEALKLKISRERVGVELDKMLTGPDPLMALAKIDELELYNTIFCDPTTPQTFEPDTRSWDVYYRLTQNFIELESPIKDILFNTKLPKYMGWMLCCFVPYSESPSAPSHFGSSWFPLPYKVAKEGIKATKKVSDAIESAFRHYDDIMQVRSAFTRAYKSGQRSHMEPDPMGRDTLGLAIRRWGGMWRSQVFFALLLEAGSDAGKGKFASGDWIDFLVHLKQEDLLEAYLMTPVINGKDLSAALRTRPGPWMKPALEVVMAWQLRNPTAINFEGAIEEVKASLAAEVDSKPGELTAALVHHFLLLTLRPLFAQTEGLHRDQVTSQGRVRTARAVGPSSGGGLEDESVTRPWKKPENEHALPLLRWCVKHLTPELAEKEWPLLIPPILTLLDDLTTEYRSLGASLLQTLLNSTSPTFLARTGLAPFFISTLSPSLHHLPTLTPEADSLTLLSSAYPTLLCLIDVSQGPGPHGTQKRVKQLRNVLHEHILPSLSHLSPSPGVSSAYPRLTALLLLQMQTVLRSLGLDAVGQLTYVIPVLQEILEDPFVGMTREGVVLVKHTAETLSLTVELTYPRAAQWRGPVISALAAAWINLESAPDRGTPQISGSITEVDQEELTALEVEVARLALKSCADALVKAVEKQANTMQKLGEAANLHKSDLELEFAGAVAADERLAGLFGGYSKQSV